MKYGIFSDKGLPEAFYDDKLHDTIPDNAIQLTDKQYLELIRNPKTKIFNTELGIVEDYSPDLNELKETKLLEIKLAFEEALSNNYMFSNVLQTNVNIGDEHLRNIEKLIDYMQASNISTTQFRVYDNSFVTVTIEQLQELRLEMISYGLYLYQKKWELESQIDNAQTIEEVQAIIW